MILFARSSGNLEQFKLPGCHANRSQTITAFCTSLVFKCGPHDPLGSNFLNNKREREKEISRCREPARAMYDVAAMCVKKGSRRSKLGFQKAYVAPRTAAHSVTGSHSQQKSRDRAGGAGRTFEKPVYCKICSLSMENRHMSAFKQLMITDNFNPHLQKHKTTNGIRFRKSGVVGS